MNSEREIRDHQDPEREPRDYQGFGREVRDYLLGVLPEKRREEIEQRFFSDDDFHLEVEIVEEELFDDYLQNKLPEPERRLFETHFLASPLRRKRLQFARAFHDKISSKTEVPVTPVLPLPATLFHRPAVSLRAGRMSYGDGRLRGPGLPAFQFAAGGT